MIGNADEVEVAIALEEAEDGASVDEVADIEALAYVVGHDFEPDVAGLVNMTVEACGHEQQGVDSAAELAAVESLDPGFDLGQPLKPEDREVVAVH